MAILGKAQKRKAEVETSKARATTVAVKICLTATSARCKGNALGRESGVGRWRVVRAASVTASPATHPLHPGPSPHRTCAVETSLACLVCVLCTESPANDPRLLGQTHGPGQVKPRAPLRRRQLIYQPLPTTDGSSLAACTPPITEPETPVDRREIPGLHLVTGSGAYLAPVMMPDEPPKAGLMPSLPEKVWMPDLSMAELLMTFLVSRSISPICSCYHSDAGSNVSDLPDPLTPAHNGHPPSTSKLPRTGMAR